VTSYRARFEGPAALALRVARALADADGVDLTDAVARVRGELPSGASIEITGG
jgi:hypothetical protein